MNCPDWTHSDWRPTARCPECSRERAIKQEKKHNDLLVAEDRSTSVAVVLMFCCGFPRGIVHLTAEYAQLAPPRLDSLEYFGGSFAIERLDWRSRYPWWDEVEAPWLKEERWRARLKTLKLVPHQPCFRLHHVRTAEAAFATNAQLSVQPTVTSHKSKVEARSAGQPRRQMQVKEQKAPDLAQGKPSALTFSRDWTLSDRWDNSQMRSARGARDRRRNSSPKQRAANLLTRRKSSRARCSKQLLSDVRDQEALRLNAESKDSLAPPFSDRREWSWQFFRRRPLNWKGHWDAERKPHSVPEWAAGRIQFEKDEDPEWVWRMITRWYGEWHNN